MKVFKKGLYILLLHAGILSAQITDSVETDSNSLAISRSAYGRLMFGTINSGESMRVLFMNIHSRSISIADKPAELSYYTEYGLNVPLVAPVFIPYIKAGPDLRFIQMVYTSAHLGFATFLASENFTPIPFVFYGIQVGLCTPLSKSLMLEIELGQNNLLLGESNDALVPYITLGVGFGP